VPSSVLGGESEGLTKVAATLKLTFDLAFDRETTGKAVVVSDEDRDSDDDSDSTDSLTIRATPRKPPASFSVAAMETVVEDYSELVLDGESDPFDTKVDSFKASLLDGRFFRLQRVSLTRALHDGTVEISIGTGSTSTRTSRETSWFDHEVVVVFRG
jgi:hypothetical protein